MRLSPSLAKILIQKSPKHAYLAATRPRDEPVERSDSMRFGAAVDRLVFGTGDEIILKTKRGQEELPGQILVTAQQLEKAAAIRTAVVNSVPRLVDEALVSAGVIDLQRKLVWQTGGIECSSKPDQIDTEYWQANDLKTAHDLSDDAIVKAIELYGYDIQAAAYIEAMQASYGWPRASFRFIFVETDAPYDVRVIEPDTAMLESGNRLWNKAKQTWKRCLETGDWPGRGNMTVSNSRYRQNRETSNWENT